MERTVRAWQAAPRTTRGSAPSARVAPPRWPRSLALACALLVAGCAEEDPIAAPVALSDEAPSRQVAVESRDGVLETSLPADVVVHVFERSVAGTSADGGFRLFIEHREPDKLIRVVGATKDALAARGWKVEAERHYAEAIEVQASKGKGASHTSRVVWFIARAGRVLLCEGIARDAQRERLGEPLRRRCQGLEVKPLPGHSAAAPAEPTPARAAPSDGSAPVPSPAEAGPDAG